MADLRQKTALLSYQMLLRILQPLAKPLLKHRLGKGKEHPQRWREKLGQTEAVRPPGRLVWLNGVGLGEVLSARSVVAGLLERDPTLSFLITSTTRISAEVLAECLPPRTQHQFLPLDSPRFAKRFLGHWHPDQAIWIEQDFWPGLVSRAHLQNIPQAIVNGRMDAKAYQKRMKARRLFKAAYEKMVLISAQDPASANHLSRLAGIKVRVQPSLKITAPPVPFDPEMAATWCGRLQSGPIWTAMSAHLADAQTAIKAHKQLGQGHLVIVPRFVDDLPQLQDMAQAAGLSHSTVAGQQVTDVIFETRYGVSSLWFHLAKFALIGGGFDATGGHNPWEAVPGESAILFGPNTANFAPDYQLLLKNSAAVMVQDAAEITQAIQTINAEQLTENASQLVDQQRQALDPLFDKLAQLMA